MGFEAFLRIRFLQEHFRGADGVLWSLWGVYIKGFWWQKYSGYLLKGLLCYSPYRN